MGPLRRFVDGAMFPGSFASYEVSSLPELKLIPALPGLAQSRIPVLVITTEAESNILLIYHRGNGSDLGALLATMRYLSQRIKAHVVAFDYPGYGKHEGFPSESAVDVTAQSVLEFVLESRANGRLGWPLKNVILHGSCIGCGPSTRLAKKYPNLGGLVLQATMPDMNVAAANWVGDSRPMRALVKAVVSRRWRVDRDIKKCHCPVLWIHGKKDAQFNYKKTVVMHEQYQGPKMLRLAETATHFDWNYDKDICKPVADFICDHVSQGADKAFDPSRARKVLNEYFFDDAGPGMVTLADLYRTMLINKRPREMPDRKKQTRLWLQWNQDPIILPTRAGRVTGSLQEFVDAWDSVMEEIIRQASVPDDLKYLVKEVYPGGSVRMTQARMQVWIQRLMAIGLPPMSSIVPKATVANPWAPTPGSPSFEEAVSFVERAYYLGCPLTHFGLVYATKASFSATGPTPCLLGLLINGIFLEPGSKGRTLADMRIDPLCGALLRSISSENTSSFQMPAGVCVLPLSVASPLPSIRPLAEALVLASREDRSDDAEHIMAELCQEWAVAGVLKDSGRYLRQRCSLVFGGLLLDEARGMDVAQLGQGLDILLRQVEELQGRHSVDEMPNNAWAFVCRLLGPDWWTVLQRLPPGWGPSGDRSCSSSRSSSSECDLDQIELEGDVAAQVTGLRLATATTWQAVRAVGETATPCQSVQQSVFGMHLASARQSAAILGTRISAWAAEHSAWCANAVREEQVTGTPLATFSFTTQCQDVDLANAEAAYAACMRCISSYEWRELYGEVLQKRDADIEDFLKRVESV